MVVIVVEVVVVGFHRDMVCVCKVSGLRRQLVVGRDAAMEEVQLRNKFLSDKLERLEQVFASRQPAGISPVHLVDIPMSTCFISHESVRCRECSCNECSRGGKFQWNRFARFAGFELICITKYM